MQDTMFYNIGIGSLGSCVAGYVKESLKHRNQLPKAEFSAIDSKPYASRGGLEYLEPHEDYHYIYKHPTEDIAKNIILHPEIMRCMPDPAQNSRSRARIDAGLTSGVGADRICGAKLAILSASGIEAMHIRKLNRLMSRNAGKRVIIITFFSLCGGTASTLCIHGGYIQRNVAKQLGCDATHIGVMILPVLYVKEHMQEQLGLKGLANVYATISDLDALSLESKFALKYSPSLHVDIEAPPFDFMIALDGSSATGANLTTITAVKKAASALMTEFVEWEHSVFFERFIDVRDVTYSTIFEKPRRFVLFGTAKLIYKPESLIKDFAIMLGKDVLGKISAKKTDLGEITADLNQFGLESQANDLRGKIKAEAIFTDHSQEGYDATRRFVLDQKEKVESALPDVEHHASLILNRFSEFLSAFSIKAASLPDDQIQQCNTIMVSFLKGEINRAEEQVQFHEAQARQLSESVIDKAIMDLDSFSSKILPRKRAKLSEQAASSAIQRYRSILETVIYRSIKEQYEEMLKRLEDFMKSELAPLQQWTSETLSALHNRCITWEPQAIKENPDELERSILTADDIEYLKAKYYPDDARLESLTEEFLKQLPQWKGQDFNEIWNQVVAFYSEPFSQLRSITLVDILAGNVLKRKIDVDGELKKLREEEAEPKVNYSLGSLNHVPKLDFVRIGKSQDEQANNRLMTAVNRSFAQDCIVFSDDPNILASSKAIIGVPSFEFPQLKNYQKVYETAILEDDTFTIFQRKPYTPIPDIKELTHWSKFVTEYGEEKNLITNGNGRYWLNNGKKIVLGDTKEEVMVNLIFKPEILEEAKELLIMATRQEFPNLKPKEKEDYCSRLHQKYEHIATQAVINEFSDRCFQ